MNYKEKIDHFRHLADKWECGEQVILTGELRVSDELRNAADIIEILMNERETAVSLPPNNPLTIEELRKMDGEPVWIIETEIGKSYWAIVKDAQDLDVGLCTATDPEDYGSFGLYGKSWLAYRCKPEKGEDDGKQV